MSELNFSIMDSTPVGIFVIDKDYNVIFWNKCLEDWTGFSKARVEGSSIRDFAPLFSDKSITSKVDTLFTDHSHIVITPKANQQIIPALKQNGKVMAQHVSANSIKGPDDLPIALFTIQDVTDLTANIKESDTMLRLVMDSTAEAIYGIDLDGQCIFVNPACIRMLGYSNGKDLLGKNMHDLIHHTKNDGSDYPVEDCSIYCAFKEETNCHTSGEYLWKKDGSGFPSEFWSYPIWERGKVTGAVVSFIDITERLEAEEALKESEERLLLAQNIARLGSWDWNVVTGEILWSDDMFAMFGIKKDGAEPTYDLFINRVHSDDRDEVSEAVKRALELKEAYDVKHRVVLPGGEVKYIHETGRVYYEDDRPVRMIGVAQDITERMKTEAELHKGQRLESLGVLAGGIAHDFNNLLTIILGNISVALGEVKEGDKIHKTLEESAKASRRAGELTSQLLSFAKGNKPIKKLINYRDLINESVSLVLSGTNAASRTNINENLSNVNVDPGQISQVVNNILINGVQAMTKGGTITVSAENVDINDDVDVLKGSYVSLMIKDEGTGMNESVMKKIFDPYFTTKDAGNGLGLASSYSIIKNHGGTIRVESIEGEGTTFTILIPAGSGIVKEDEDNSKVVSSGEGKMVLVMDDDVSIAELIELILVQHGFTVSIAATGEDAILVYKEALKGGSPFDAVIMDLTIRGGMGGRDAIGILKKLDPNICAIVSSGYSNDAIMGNFEKFGFSGSVSKPYNAKDLVNVLDEALKNKKNIKI